MKHPIFMDEDNGHFYFCNNSDTMTVEGLHGLVDEYCDGTNVGAVAFCANVQRALYDSQVWESLYHDYDPDSGPDQACLQWLPEASRDNKVNDHGRMWVHNLHLLKERNIDHLQVWVDRCRHHKREGWISVRMNDCHHNSTKDAFWHPTLWRERPDLYRADHRDEGWFEKAFDYNQPEVVEHHMALIEELLERYDMDGILIDWVRWVKMFAPGHEGQGRAVLTDVMRRVRQLAAAAARRIGHPVEVGVRLPAHMSASLAWGFDVITWAQEDLADLVICGIFLNQTLYDFELEQWRALFPNHVRFIAQLEHCMHAYPNAGSAGEIKDYQLLLGAAASAHHEGADGVYLFNECYRYSPTDTYGSQYENIREMLITLPGDKDALRDHPRRHALSYSQIMAPGRDSDTPLPVPFEPAHGAYHFSRFRPTAVLSINLGLKPASAVVILSLGCDCALSQDEREAMNVWVNAQPVSPAALPAQTTQHDVKGKRLNGSRPLPAVCANHTYHWAVPLELLQDGNNCIEIDLPQRPGHVAWAELSVW